MPQSGLKETDRREIERERAKKRVREKEEKERKTLSKRERVRERWIDKKRSRLIKRENLCFLSATHVHTALFHQSN